MTEVWPEPEWQLVEVMRNDGSIIARHRLCNDTITVYDTIISRYLEDPIVDYPKINIRESNMQLEEDACYERRRVIAETGRNKYGMYYHKDLIIKWSKVN